LDSPAELMGFGFILVSKLSGKGSVEEGLFQRLQRGELPLVEAGERGVSAALIW
jgi:hypothetical protein